MRCLVISLCFLVAACSSVEFDEIASAGAGTGGCLVGHAVAGPAGCLAGGAAAGGATIVVTPASAPPETKVDITKVETPEQAEVAKTQIFWNFVQTFIEWIIGGFVVLMIAMWLIPGPQTLIPWRKKHDNSSNSG